MTLHTQLETILQTLIWRQLSPRPWPKEHIIRRITPRTKASVTLSGRVRKPRPLKRYLSVNISKNRSTCKVGFTVGQIKSCQRPTLLVRLSLRQREMLLLILLNLQLSFPAFSNHPQRAWLKKTSSTLLRKAH